MIRRSVGVSRSVHEQNWNSDLRSCRFRTYRIHVEPALPLRNLKCTCDDAVREEERCPFSRYLPKIGEGFGSDHRGHSPVRCCFLQSNGRAQRRSDQYDWSGVHPVQYTIKILFLEESVGADVPW